MRYTNTNSNKSQNSNLKIETIFVRYNLTLEFRIETPKSRFISNIKLTALRSDSGSLCQTDTICTSIESDARVHFQLFLPV